MGCFLVGFLKIGTFGTFFVAETFKREIRNTIGFRKWDFFSVFSKIEMRFFGFPIIETFGKFSAAEKI